MAYRAKTAGSIVEAFLRRSTIMLVSGFKVDSIAV